MNGTFDDFDEMAWFNVGMLTFVSIVGGCVGGCVGGAAILQFVVGMPILSVFGVA